MTTGYPRCIKWFISVVMLHSSKVSGITSKGETIEYYPASLIVSKDCVSMKNYYKIYKNMFA